jgi:hypothetical protein
MRLHEPCLTGRLYDDAEELKRVNTACRVGGPIIDGATYCCDDKCYNHPYNTGKRLQQTL